MTRSSLVAALFAAMLLAGCGADEVAPPEGPPDHGFTNIKTDNGAARSATINESGGVITTTGAGGAVYTLTVPSDAIDSSVTIRMYPITSITGYPLASGVVAGVHLEPEGFIPSKPLTLTIDLPSNVPATASAPLASKGNGADHQLYPAIIAGRRVTFTLAHFSQYTIGDATLDALLALPTPQGSSSAQFQNDLALMYITAQRRNESPAAADYATLLNNWYNQVLVPLFTRLAAETDRGEAIALLVTDVTEEYNAWLSAISFCVATAQGSMDLSASTDDARRRLSTGILNTIILVNAEVVSLAGADPAGPSDAVVIEMAETAGLALAAQFLASTWDLDAASSGLDLQSVLNSIPIKVVITGRSLPSTFAPAAIGNLEVRAGVRILDRPVRTSPAVTVRLSNVQGGSVSPAAGQTNSQGVFQSTAQWTSGTTFSVDMIAAIERPTIHPRARVRVFDRLTVRHQQNAARAGSWKKLDHIWIDQDGTENSNGLIVKTNATSRLFVYNPFGGLTLVFDMPIAWTDDSFTGSGVISGGSFAGWNATANGTVRSDGMLQFTWSIGGGAQSWRGSDVFPVGE